MRNRKLPTLIIATRVSRPWNIPAIGDSLRHAFDRAPDGCPVAWYLLCDTRSVAEMEVPKAIAHSGITLGVKYFERIVAGQEIYAAMCNSLLDWACESIPIARQEQRPSPWVVFIDDDTIVHEDLISEVSATMENSPEAVAVWVQQVRTNGQILGNCNFSIGQIDIGQGILNLGKIPAMRFRESAGYENDGDFFCQVNASRGGECVRIDKILSLHNGLA